MRVTNYTEYRANTKNIPLAIVHLVAERKCATTLSRELRNDKCRCGVTKQEWTGYGVWQGQRFGIALVVCVRCDETKTVYRAPSAGRTPIRDDQWAKGQRGYRATCEDCGKRFTITARTWEELRKTTNHRCKGNKLVNLVSEEHKHLTGKDFPKELFG